MSLEGDKPIICAGKRGLVKVDFINPVYWADESARSWSMGEEEPCLACGVPMFYTKGCFQCPACGFKEGCG